jgi:hypothetical protein
MRTRFALSFARCVSRGEASEVTNLNPPCFTKTRKCSDTRAVHRDLLLISEVPIEYRKEPIHWLRASHSSEIDELLRIGRRGCDVRLRICTSCTRAHSKTSSLRRPRIVFQSFLRWLSPAAFLWRWSTSTPRRRPSAVGDQTRSAPNSYLRSSPNQATVSSLGS